MANNKIPVVMINWDAIDVTKGCVESLWQDSDMSQIEIVVIDNGSTDADNVNQLSQLQAEKKITRVLSFKENMGFSVAFNMGFSETEGEVLCYMSNDCRVQAGWLDAALATLRTNNRIAAVCSNVDTPEYAAINKEDIELEQLYGAIMLVRRSAWDDIGCFDYINFSPAYSEELDWSYRAIRKGYKLMCSGKSNAYHIDHATMDKKYDREEIHLIRLKHRVKCRLINHSVIKLVGNIRQYWSEIKEDLRNGTFKLFVSALVYNIRLLPSLMVERRKRMRREKIEFALKYKTVVDGGMDRISLL